MVTRYAIITGGKVANVAAAQPSFAHQMGWIEAPPQVAPGWLYSGGVFSPPPEPPVDPAAMIETYRRAVQAHVDATAQARGYDSGVSAASYAGDPNPAWAAEAAAFIAWRSAVWVAVFDALAEVQAGDADAPESPAALIATLPAMVWPA